MQICYPKWWCRFTFPPESHGVFMCLITELFLTFVFYLDKLTEKNLIYFIILRISVLTFHLWTKVFQDAITRREKLSTVLCFYYKYRNCYLIQFCSDVKTEMWAWKLQKLCLKLTQEHRTGMQRKKPGEKRRDQKVEGRQTDRIQTPVFSVWLHEIIYLTFFLKGVLYVIPAHTF